MTTPESVTDQNAVGWRFDNSYARLPDVFFEPALPASVRAPELSILNTRLASDLGLSLSSQSPEAVAKMLAGQNLPADCQPIAQAYAGHQFGGFTMLGDGRAILIGEHLTPTNQRVDIQFKGAGRTRFSRGGDGRAALGPMLREYVMSEALSALGIPTTRSLAVVTTGEPVYRDSPRRGAILTRVAASHMRVGTFQYLAARRDIPNLRLLADYAIARHYPHLIDDSQKYRQFFRAVTARQAALIAQWQLVGFIHGVMNTDNMAISGETIDYGPCAFMNAYHHDTVFSSIDSAGRYAYGNQPTVAQWNLARFAESLLPILDPDIDQAITLASETLNEFPSLFKEYWLAGMRKKLGLQTIEADDAALVESLLAWMQSQHADYTNTFRDLSEQRLTDDRYRHPDFVAWHSRWQFRLRTEGQSSFTASARMRTVNPAIIPRNHHVEAALSAAEDENDLSPLHRLLVALASPYALTADSAAYQDPSDDAGYQTYCGT